MTMLGISMVLRAHELLRPLSELEVDRVCQISALRHFEKQETIYEHHRSATHLWLCLEGGVELRLPVPETEAGQVIATVSRGELFGVAGLLGDERHTTSARAGSAVELLAIEARPFLRLLEGNARVAQLLLQQVARDYRKRYLEVIQRFQRALRDLPRSS